jgi:hypothetical protein
MTVLWDSCKTILLQSVQELAAFLLVLVWALQRLRRRVLRSLDGKVHVHLKSGKVVTLELLENEKTLADAESE